MSRDAVHIGGGVFCCWIKEGECLFEGVAWDPLSAIQKARLKLALAKVPAHNSPVGMEEEKDLYCHAE